LLFIDSNTIFAFKILHMKKTILLLGIISLCIQCRMLGPADFAVTPIPTKIDLPRLEILTHQQSFGAMFGNALWGNQFLMYDNSWSTFMPLGYQRSIAARNRRWSGRRLIGAIGGPMPCGKRAFRPFNWR
jgi:hypothetical protein